MTDQLLFITDNDIDKHAVGTRTKYIAAEWAKKGYNVNLVSKNSSLEFKRYHKDGLTISLLPSFSKLRSPLRKVDTLMFFLVSFIFLQRFSKFSNIKFIFAAGIFPSFVSHISNFFGKNSKIIQDVPGIVPIEKKIRNKTQFLSYYLSKFLTDYTFRKSNIICTINKTHSYLIRKYYSRCDVVVVRDGADPSRFNPSLQSNFRKEEGIRDDTCIIVFVGSLTSSKLDDLVSVIPSFKDSNLKVIVLGSGKLKGFYQDKISNLGMSDFFDFKGFVSDEDLVDFLSISDITFSDFWSKYGFPRKVFEYLSMGKPIIVKSSLPVREVLTDGYNSFLYDDLIDFKTKISRLINEPKLRLEMGENAYLTSRNFTWSSQVKILREHVSNV